MIMTSSSSEGDRKNLVNSNTRGRMQMIADILNYLTVYRRKKYLMDKANLNLEQVNFCLGQLVKKEFVQVGLSSEGNLIYKITEKGRGLLEYYYYMMQEFLQYYQLAVQRIKEGYIGTKEYEEANLLFH